MSDQRDRGRRGKRTRYIVTTPHLLYIITIFLVVGFILGYITAFAMWWNR